MSGVALRRATAADGPALLELVEGLADYERLARPDAGARERLLSDAFGARPRFDCLLALVDGAPAGYAIFFETYSTFLARPTLFLEDLFVLPSARGRGAGGALFRAVAAEARCRGCGRMEWQVLKWNTLATDFYDRMGAEALNDWQSCRLDGAALAAVASEAQVT